MKTAILFAALSLVVLATCIPAPIPEENQVQNQAVKAAGNNVGSQTDLDSANTFLYGGLYGYGYGLSYPYYGGYYGYRYPYNYGYYWG